MSFKDRLAHGWDAFVNAQKDNSRRLDYGPSVGIRPDRIRYTNIANDKSLISAIYNRIAIDVAAVLIQHVRLDDEMRYKETLKTGLNTCLTVEANLDQAARHFRQDIAETLCNKGTVAIIPVETTGDPLLSQSYDIQQLRVGEVVAWYPQHVRVKAYNQKNGKIEEMTIPKKVVAIVENPLYSVMNEPNGTLQRLIRKLSMLDSVDEQMSSGKMDMIIQLPYVLKTETQKIQAANRRDQIEEQLRGSKYGIAYTDGTEKITQLNRPVENNMLAQVKYLQESLYGQLGLTEGIFNGTATESEMVNYRNRTVEPILTAIVEAMRRTFLTKSARTQKQSIEFFRDPFALVSISDAAEISDKLVRNEIMTSNEIRTRLFGLKPIDDPKADQLVNPNLKVQDTGVAVPGTDAAPTEDTGPDPVSSMLDDFESQVDDMLSKATANG